MAKILVAQLLDLMDDAFDGPDWHSLLTNLGSVTPDDWTWVPPGGQRSIRDIVGHVGGCKFAYHAKAFGDGRLGWDDPLVLGVGALDTIPTAIPWLRRGHARLRDAVAALDDADLALPRGHHSGQPRETRWIVKIMTQHDLYHAGEINHIRALRQGNDER